MIGRFAPPGYFQTIAGFTLCLSEFKLAGIDDDVRREMA